MADRINPAAGFLYCVGRTDDRLRADSEDLAALLGSYEAHGRAHLVSSGEKRPGRSTCVREPPWALSVRRQGLEPRTR
ncbi:hypothetical protein [Streptomyces sp. NPDC048496]|uniref:hypothetical protein n=1 Tax=Streptomyces sp. NPDC048496 TaxID=3365558 RepID=UPI003714D821